jgi:hypothetical protein
MMRALPGSRNNDCENAIASLGVVRMSFHRCDFGLAKAKIDSSKIDLADGAGPLIRSASRDIEF